MHPSNQADNPPTQLESLQCRAVRTLANAIFAPPLLQLDDRDAAVDTLPLLAPQHNAAPLFFIDEHWDWLQQLDRNPGALLSTLAETQQASRRRLPKLGEFHEQLLQFFLANNGQTELLAHNLKVHDGSRDIGEFDIIYRNSEGHLVHLELACKYYLASQQAATLRSDTTALDCWIGPGRRDLLARKLTHSVERQLQLAAHPSAFKKLTLLTGALPTTLRRQLHIGGRLFYPAVAKDPEAFAPEGLNPSHQRGQWMRYSDWLQETCDSPVWQRLHKPWWMDKLPLADQLPQSLQDRGALEPASCPAMIQQRCEAGNDSYRFIVPDDWDTQTIG